MIDYDDDTQLEETAGSGSPTSRAIAAYEAYARAHLPRLVEEALEATVAEQTQPIEESLRRALAEIVRDCHSRLAQNFLQHRSSNLGEAGVQIETLPSFYIEPLNLTDETSFFDPNLAMANVEGPIRPQTDSGYASVNQANYRDSGGDFEDQSMRNGSGSLNDSSNDINYICDGSEVTYQDWDWSAIMGNDYDDHGATNGVDSS